MEDEVRRARVGPEVVGLLAESLELVGGVVVSLGSAAWSAPSPCAGWDARQVVNHLAAVTSKFTRFALGEDGLIRQQQMDLSGPDPANRFLELVADSNAAWAANPLALTRVCHLPFGSFDGTTAAGINLLDAVVHGWDLATAVGERWAVDDRSAVAALAVGELLVTPEARATGQFGDPHPDVGSPLQRLLAHAGRG